MLSMVTGAVMIGDVSGYKSCRFKLSITGKFALESCVQDGDGNTACFRAFLGKTQEDWDDR